MFPAPADIEFFKEAKRIQELWEPKEGDWVKTRYDGIQVLKTDDDSRYLVWHIGRTYPNLEAEMYLSGGNAEKIKEECIWLPRQGQLQEMLEERGYSSQIVVKPDISLVNIWGEDLAGRFDEGPTPSIALGKCLLEVLGKEELKDVDMWIGEDIEAEIKRQISIPEEKE